MYDDKVREFVKNIGIENIGKRLINSKEGAVSHLVLPQPFINSRTALSPCERDACAGSVACQCL